mmetsp:Transcript_22608/g.28894  ORF Transcript_22608/g.28894 Transcript_22608/m.28894 type:complete len:91 (+) Transcript_22608:84-356(+)
MEIRPWIYYIVNGRTASTPLFQDQMNGHESKKISRNLVIFQQTRSINTIDCTNDKKLHGCDGKCKNDRQSSVCTFLATFKKKEKIEQRNV